jgi:hypothetical protein
MTFTGSPGKKPRLGATVTSLPATLCASATRPLIPPCTATVLEFTVAASIAALYVSTTELDVGAVWLFAAGEKLVNSTPLDGALNAACAACGAAFQEKPASTSAAASALRSGIIRTACDVFMVNLFSLVFSPMADYVTATAAF